MKIANSRKCRASSHDTPFSQLIKQDVRLAQLRQSYARYSTQARREAADWAYYASSANDLFNRALAQAGRASPFADAWPSGIEALTIDPTFAPALLTVDSMEYQLGRKHEAQALFQSLLKLAKDTPDLEVIIDKAGTFLLDADGFDGAHMLYAAACSAFPESTRLLGGLGYVLGKLGRRAEAVAFHRRALMLARDNPELLNDLGWALAENSEFEEAEQVLRQAVALAPLGYDRPRNNLEEVRRLKKSAGERP